MTRKEWAALVVVLGAVTTLQLVSHRGSEQHHDSGPMLGAESPAANAPDRGVEPADSGSFRTVSLEVRGMT